MSRNPPTPVKHVDQDDNDARSEFSYTSFSTDPRSVAVASILTASELYPGDSVSRRCDPTTASRVRSIISNGTSNLMTGEPTLAPTTSGDLYKVIDGRVFSSQSDVYALPADEEEHSRLDIQHFAYCLWMDSLYPFKTLVRHALREGQTPPPEILDVGTGSGRWAMDMAISFPQTNIVGLDIVPPASLDANSVPSNCHFEIDDMNLSMDHNQSVFSVVHARMSEAGLNDPESFCYEMARILRPGGVFILGRADIQIYDENKLPLPWVEPGQPGFCWVQYICGHIYRSYLTRGSVGINGALWWKEWLDTNPNFTNAVEEDAWIPLGPWKQGLNERETLAANMMREDMSRAFIAHRCLLSSEGHVDEDIDHWTEEANKELRDMNPRIYYRGAYVGGVRSEGPWQERPMRVAPEDLLARSLVLGADLARPWVRGDSDSTL